MGNLGLEQITDYFGHFRAEAAQRNFDKIDAGAPDLGGGALAIRAGKVAVTFSASQASNIVTVPHGLGRVPVAVLATLDTTPPAVVRGFVNVANLTDQQFIAAAQLTTGAASVTTNFYWIALG